MTEPDQRDSADIPEWAFRQTEGAPAPGYIATIVDTVANVAAHLPPQTRLFVVGQHHRVRIAPDEVAHLKATLEMPNDAQPRAYRIDGATISTGGLQLNGTPVPRHMPKRGEDWREYVLTLFGILTPEPIVAGPIVRTHFDGLEADMRVFLQVWLATIKREGSLARLDYRWHPERGEAFTVRDLEHARLKDGRLSVASMKREADKVLAGLPLIQQVFTGGNPQGNTYALPDDDPERVARSYYCLLENLPDGKRPSKDKVADDLGTTRPTLQSFIERHGIPWPPPRPTS